MIFVSSSCVKTDTIGQAVKQLADQGFRHIELSGGTGYYDHLLDDLLSLKTEYGLNYLVHNYFPPPKEDFILNLASLDLDIFDKSLAHMETALEMTRLLGGERFGFHAGFFVDRPVSEIGRVFQYSPPGDRDKAIDQFCRAFDLLKAGYNDIQLYIENNCYSASNYSVYGDRVPFMLLDLQDWEQLVARIDCNLLLDVGHLMINAKTLGFDFNNVFNELFQVSDYIHISYNDSCHDLNLGLSQGDDLVDMLKPLAWNEKIVTLEIYEGMDALRATHDIVSSFYW